ncbi:unnamed protein product, partial [Prorocentrum cordatum]
MSHPEVQEAASAEVQLQGWMLKLSSGRGRSRWQRRYFVLEDNELRYFHKEGSKSVKKRFDLRNARLSLGGTSADPRELVLKFQERSWHLRAESAQLAQQWLTTLEDARDLAEERRHGPRDDTGGESEEEAEEEEDEQPQEQPQGSPPPEPAAALRRSEAE